MGPLARGKLLWHRPSSTNRAADAVALRHFYAAMDLRQAWAGQYPGPAEAAAVASSEATAHPRPYRAVGPLTAALLQRHRRLAETACLLPSLPLPRCLLALTSLQHSAQDGEHKCSLQMPPLPPPPRRLLPARLMWQHRSGGTRGPSLKRKVMSSRSLTLIVLSALTLCLKPHQQKERLHHQRHIYDYMRPPTIGSSIDSTVRFDSANIQRCPPRAPSPLPTAGGGAVVSRGLPTPACRS